MRPSSLLQGLASALTGLPTASSATTSQAAVLLADHIVAARKESRFSLSVAGDSAEERAATRATRGSTGDMDDVHWGELIHPGAVIWPVVLEVGVEVGATGVDVLRGARIGYETMVRLAALFPRETRAPLHMTAIVGPVGAAAAASALLEPGGAVSHDALGHALSVAGGSSGALVELSDTRSFHRAHAVRTGIAAARAARSGLRSTSSDLEAHGGVLSMVSAWERGAVTGLTASGDRAIDATSVRVFPTSGWNQVAYEAAREAALQSPGTVTRIHVAVEAAAPRQSTGFGDAWTSLEFAVAAAAAEGAGDSRPPSDLLDLVVVDAPRASRGATVSVRTTSGSGGATVVEPLGHPARPARPHDLTRKWGLDEAAISEYLTAIERALSDIGRFSVPAQIRRNP